MLAAVLRRQRVHLLTELRSLADAKASASRSPVVALLVTAAELHVRADLGVVDAAERDLTPGTLAALRVPRHPREHSVLSPTRLSPTRHDDQRGPRPNAPGLRGCRGGAHNGWSSPMTALA